MGYCATSLVVSLLSLCIRPLVFCLCFALVTAKTTGNETNRLALLQFKAKITHDPFGVLNSWNDTVHFCQWYGVTCSRRHQRVTRLDLPSLKFSGSISPYIGNLSFLSELHLPNNSFSQRIPSQVGRLRRLRSLNLDNNSIGGEIPSNISSCSNLLLLTIENNQLLGEIPMELGSMMMLQEIYISRNNLIGSIPPSFGNITTLKSIVVTMNNLSGSIPDALGQLTNLQLIGLGLNRLSGTIPSSFFNLSSLTTFHVGDNQFHGSLPLDLFNTLPNIQDFVFLKNQFTGPFPVSISNASNLKRVTVSFNKLTGKIPTLEKLHKLQRFGITSNPLGNGKPEDLSFLCSLTNATSLEIAGIRNNGLGGVLPECISNFSTNLTILALGSNKIFGSIPTGIGNLVNLGRLNMGNNQLSGRIPADIVKLQKLSELDLHSNSLSGTIPPSLGNLTLLSRLDLGNNSLKGSIPSSLGKFQSINYLDLSRNNLSGTIPPEVIGLSSLSISLSLSNNHLTGSLPMEVGKLTNVGSIHLQENMLSGEIPSSLGSCVRLEFLNMQGNFFRGIIPLSLSTLRGIQRLDLSRNNLSGKIPEFLEGFGFMQLLNLSYNNFEGNVPVDGAFKNASAVSVKGNYKLCGGIPEFQLPVCKSEGSKKRRLTPTVKLIISIIFALLAVAFFISFLFLRWLRKKRKEATPSPSGNSLLKLSYQSLLKATDGFSSANLIGVGSFGSVYKGILDLDDTPIAIKVLNLLRHGATTSFIAECEALRNIKHRNLVKVLTVCSGVDDHGNDFKALIYEFMVNGSLEEWLHPIHRIDETHEEPRNLNLLQRLNVVIDVACALDYLHHHCHTTIVHCDLKPSNVLLDGDLVGHVGDFGLARFLQEASVNQASSIGVRGTVGYTAPEYGTGSQVSPYGDVYSFGILILEMFMGKRPTNEMFKDHLNIHNFAKEALPERVVEISDSILLRENEEVERRTDKTCNQICSRKNNILECLISIFEIGVACSVELPWKRMNISDVVVELHLIRNNLIETRTGVRETNYSNNTPIF